MTRLFQQQDTRLEKVPSLPPKSAVPPLSEARQRAPLNLLANSAWLLLNTIINFWYVPFLIGHLGVAVYGLIPLTSSLTRYMTVFTDGFNSAISRFLTIDLAQDNVERANQTFNTAVSGSALIALFLLPLAFGLALLAPRIFDVPLGYEQDAQWTVLLVIVAFLVTTFASSFATPSFAYHRFDLRFLVNAGRLLAEVGTIILFFALLPPHLWQVGVGMVVAALCLLTGYVVVWRKLTPQLIINIRRFSSARLREMAAFSGWVLVNQVGSLLFLNIDLVVANLVFGAVVGGRYGAVIMFPSLLRSLAATINGILIPVTMTLYAQERLSQLVYLSQKSVKFLGLLMALPIGLLCGLSVPLLAVWLGPEFSDLSWLVVALVAHLAINTAVIPLFSLQVVTNRVRVPALVTLISGVFNAVLAVALASWSGWGYISIAIAGAVVLTAKNGIFTPLYGARILNLPWHTFLPPLLAGVVGCLGVMAVAWSVVQIFPVNDWLSLLLLAGIVSVCYAAVVYLGGLNKAEKQLLHAELARRISR